jgi:hypothetical protein
MGWCTTSDPDRFAAAAGGYLRSRAAENSLLLSATAPPGGLPTGQWPDAASAAEPLFGWWEPPDGGGPRAAFVHDPAQPLLISGRAPEMAATLAATLAKMGRTVSGVDAPTEAADAFAAAWSQRSGTAVRMHKHCRVYRLTATLPGEPAAAPGQPAVPWPSPESPGPAGRLRVATAQDLPLLADWLAAFSAESVERIGSPQEMAADLIGYGGAIFWDVQPRPARRWDPARSLPFPHRDAGHRDAGHRDASHRDTGHRDTGQAAEPVLQPVALATLSRPMAGTVRIVALYTPPERRRHGYAAALTIAVGRAVLTGALVPGVTDTPGVPTGPAAGHPRAGISEIVMITDRNRPEHWGGLAGYQLVGERTVLRFGPATGPAPRLRATGPMPRMPTGPLPRLPRLRRSW